MKRLAGEYAVFENLSPSDYFVFFHTLKVHATDEHFEVAGGIEARVEEFNLSFNVNKKQIEGGSIHFVNHLVRPDNGEPNDIHSIPTPNELVYFIPSSYFVARRAFQNMIVTFIHSTVRKHHRKIKVTVSVRPTREYASRLTAVNRVRATHLDAVFAREVQINLPLLDQPSRDNSPARTQQYNINLFKELKFLEYIFRKEMKDPIYTAIIQDAIEFVKSNDLDNAARSLSTVLEDAERSARTADLEEVLSFLRSKEVAQCKNMGQKFRIALSFAGGDRQYVENVAYLLRNKLGKHGVFYDKFYQDRLARPDLDIYLQKIYHDQSELIVFFISKGYADKEWCGLEWRAIRDLIKRKKAASIMPVRLDQTIIPGLFSIDGCIDASKLDADDLVEIIVRRLETGEVNRCNSE